MISEGPLSANVVLVGAQGTNWDPEGYPRFLIIFPFITMEKKLFYSLWAPMGPPVAVGPGKKFRLSHPLSGPASGSLYIWIFKHLLEPLQPLLRLLEPL